MRVLRTAESVLAAHNARMLVAYGKDPTMKSCTKTGWMHVGRAVRGLCAAALVLAGTAALGGCYQRSNYPQIPTSVGFNENPNTPSGEQAMVAAVQFVASRYAPGQREFDPSQDPRTTPMVNYPAVVNLPMGMRRSFYERIAAKVGPQVLPATPQSVVEARSSGAPVFHVSRVWMRFDRAYVDVLRPMPELGPAPDGTTIYQMITCHLEGGLRPWRVVYTRTWHPGDAKAPEYWFLPSEDRPNEHELAMRGLTERQLAQREAELEARKREESGLGTTGGEGAGVLGVPAPAGAEIK